MKAIALFMSMLFFCLAIMPCTDAMVCDEDDIEMSHDHHGQDEKDDCTPLCVCSCCGVIYTLPETITMSISSRLFMTEPILCFARSYSSRFQESIWQPPTQC